MKYVFAASAAAFLCTSASLAFAQGTQPPTTQNQMSKAECQAIWSKADSAQNDSLTSSQAAPYVTNFKAVDMNGDGKLSSSEFMSGCQRGLAHDTANIGAGSGESGGATPPIKRD